MNQQFFYLFGNDRLLSDFKKKKEKRERLAYLTKQNLILIFIDLPLFEISQLASFLKKDAVYKQIIKKSLPDSE